jgi:hypothetical protein
MSMKITIVAVTIALATADAMGAQAQTAPPQPTAAVAKPISLSISPALIFNTGGDENPRRSAFAPYQVTALGFRFGYDITKRLTIYWNRATPSTMNGRYYNDAHVAVYGTIGDDINDTYGLTYAVTKTFSVDAGYTRRWRIAFPAAADPSNSNPSYYSGAYLQPAWRFGPTTRVGQVFTLSATVADIDHRLNPAALAAVPGKGAGINAPGWEIVCISCGLSARFPVFGQTLFVPRIGYSYAANYAASAVYPPFANIYDLGADIVPTNFLTITLTARNYNGHEIGYPPPTPQSQHYSYLSIIATFHGRFALPK